MGMIATVETEKPSMACKLGRHPLQAGTRLGRIACWLSLGFVLWYAFVSPVLIAMFGRSTVVPPLYVLVPMILVG